MDVKFYDPISSRYFVINDCDIYGRLTYVEEVLNQRLNETKIVTLNHVYDLLGVDRLPIGDKIGWLFNPLREIRVYGKENFSRRPLCIELHYSPEPEPFAMIPRRSGKTLCAEAIKHIFEEYGLENRKENNMKSKSDIPCILIGKKGDPRGVHAVELKIKNVIFNDPATIVFWSDGTKTVVKCGANDVFDPEKGLAMAISKKMLGNNYKAYGRFKKWLPKEYGEKPLPEKIGSGSVPWDQLTKENKDNAAH